MADAPSWAPQSPDLSSYHSSSAAAAANNAAEIDDYYNEPVHPQHQGYRGSISLPTNTLSSSLPPYSSSPPQQHTSALHSSASSSSPIAHNKFLPSYPPASSSSTSFPAERVVGMPRGGMSREESMQDAEYVPDGLTERQRGKRAKEGNGLMMMGGGGIAPATANANAPGGEAAPPPGGAPSASVAAQNINITYHFPVARIKRIMQADDDVGKVAQVTPVVVSKALELFMISLVTKAAAEAKARNSKRVAAVHLKQAITKDEQFDFLNEIVAKVADAPEVKSEGDSMDVDGKKKKASGRRKKKTDDDDF